MGRPVWLVENLFSRRIFPGHTLSASSTETGLDIAFVGTGRRQRALNRWAPSATNTDAWARATFDRVRAFDHVFLDRGHNLGGYTVQVQVSSDGFASYTVAASATIPTSVYPYSRLDDGRPVLTEEGAVAWRTGLYVGNAVRLFVPAMGAGLKPEIVGIHAGVAFSPEHAVVKPFTHGRVETLYEEFASPQAWVAAGEIAKRRTDEPRLKLADRSEYARARYHIEGLFFARKPAWYVPDDEEAEKAWYAVKPPGVAGFSVEGDWSEFQGSIPMVEHEPRLVGT
jgi:hypothetical protein